MRTVKILTMAVLTIALAAPAAAGVPSETSEEAVDTETTSDTPSEPVLLFIQGRLKPGGEATYDKYIKGTGPLMAEYGVAVDAVGTGIADEHTTDAWPVNAILRFTDRATAEAFLADPRYIEIKEKYRDEAYEELHLSFVQTRTPKVRTPKAVAEEAFADFRAGLATGEWEPFLARLSDDFTFHFPLGVTADGTRVIFEFKDHGVMFGKPYANQVAISLDVCGEQICGYREYFGLVGPPPAE